MKQLGVVGIVMAMGLGMGTARADVDRDDFDRLGKGLPAVPPEFGFETAKGGPPTWCAGIEKLDGDSWSPDSIRIDPNSLERMIQSARLTCLWPKEPAVQKAVGLVLQEYINFTGLPAATAADALKARLSPDRWNADLKKVCAALTISDEIHDGEEKAFLTARQSLFGCPNSPPMWEANGRVPDILTYLDASSTEADAIARLAWLLSRTNYIFEHPDKVELSYIFDQVDYPLLTDAAVTKMLDTAPYKGNATARTVILESWGRTKAAIRLIGVAVQKQTAKDPDWKELLITAPQAGIAAWTKASTQAKDALARSAAFEARLFGPSLKAARGCWPELRKDFVEIAKAMPHATAKEFTDTLSEPVVSLLFSRLVACAALDTDAAYVSRLETIESKVRWSRGPRVVAQYAALDALTKILADRTKFPVEANFLRLMPDRSLHEVASRQWNMDKSKIDTIGWGGDSGSGTVAAVKKVAAGVQVSFVKTKAQYMGQSCTQTNRIVTFDLGGSPIYYQSCKDTGMVTYDSTAKDITVPSEWADGIKAGASMDFDTARGEAPGRIALPMAVYADKARKKLVNFAGFGL